MISDCNEYEGGFTMVDVTGRWAFITGASKAALDKITIDLGSTVEGTDVMINLTVRIN